MKYSAELFKKEISNLFIGQGLRDFYTIFEPNSSQNILVLNKDKLFKVFQKHKVKLENVSVSGDKINFEFGGKWNPKITSNLFDVNDDIKRFDVSHADNNGYIELTKNVKMG